MSIKNKILELLLVKEELTSLEITKELGIGSDTIWVYLNKLYKEKKIERITDKKPYVYRSITPLAYLKRICKLMNDKLEFNKVPDKEDKELVIQIMELIK